MRCEYQSLRELKRKAAAVRVNPGFGTRDVVLTLEEYEAMRSVVEKAATIKVPKTGRLKLAS